MYRLTALAILTTIRPTQGISVADAKTIVDIISKNKETFVDIMMVEELGLMPPVDDGGPWKNGACPIESRRRRLACCF